MTPLKPRPRVVPRASTNSPALKTSSSFTTAPTSNFATKSSPQRSSLRMRFGVMFAFL
jgi:hypothetical protein